MKKVLAFDCGGTNTRLALINEKYEIEKTFVTKTIVGDKEKWVENLIQMIDQFPLENVVAIGLGVPGEVDRKNGVIVELANVQVKDIKIREILEEKYHLPIYIRNDAEVACLGEAYLGAGKGKSRVVFLTISTGLGVSLCVDGKLQDYLTEVGHTACVYKNHVTEYEKIVSGLNICNLAKFNEIDSIKCAPEMFDGVRKNNPIACSLFNEWLNLLSSFIELIETSYSPNVICVTGGLMKSKDVYFKKLRKFHKEISICECHFKEDAGLIGAGVFAFNPQ